MTVITLTFLIVANRRRGPVAVFQLVVSQIRTTNIDSIRYITSSPIV